MKYLKQKLMASLAMVLVAATMMGTSTYAWFAISTAPEVTEISTTMTATGAFEIALSTNGSTTPDDTDLGDAGDQEKWGSTVTNIESATGLNFPVQINSNVFETVAYDANGRAETELVSVTPARTYDDEGGVSYDADITIGTETENKVVASGVALWLRTNTTIDDATATLGTITVKGSNDDNFNDSVFKVAIVDVENKTYYELTEGKAIDICGFTEDEATLIEVIVYMDGDTIQNADIDEELTITIDEIVFASDTITGLGADDGGTT